MSRSWPGRLVCAALVLGTMAHAARPSDSGWKPLFDGKTLDGWYTFLQTHGRNSDPDRVITIEDNAIHLYKHAAEGDEVVMGYIGTEREYGNYHLRWQFKWGEKKFKPRYELKRDAGLYYHIQGDDAVWPCSLQFQIQQTDVGDLLALYGMQLDTSIDPDSKSAETQAFLPIAQGGERRVLGGKGIGYQRRLTGDFERDGWNTCEIVVRGQEVTHILNGQVVNHGTGVRLVDPADPARPAVPVTKGRIALEIEAAEVFFRNIEIRALDTESGKTATSLRAGAASAVLEAHDDMVIGGGIGPGKVKGQEGELRASAAVIEAPDGSKACLVACDVLMLERDVLDQAAREIAARTGIPFESILINATHTHHAPTTVTIHGYKREEAFARHVGDKIVEAAVRAYAERKPVSFRFRLGEESSVGQNSRLLLQDGTIFWVGSREDAVRPTGPFDPELPVLVFERADGGLEAVLFNHSTHTIGTLKPGVRSPSFYGLAAQELESKHGGTFIFLEGASGSTHNLTLSAAEAQLRISAAVEAALAAARVRPIERIRAAKKEIGLSVRHFDEAADDAAVVAYCTKRQPAPYHDLTIKIFRDMRKQLAPRQGEERKTWIQAIVLGDVALVGVPAEFFTVLGQEIKRRSPYRYTYICELANDYVGYVGDARAYELGGYQTWTGLHSYLQKGSGEVIVEEVVGLLEQLAAE